MKTRDAYLFMNDQKETLVFVYIKMTKEQLQQSLKNTYIDYNNNDEVHKKKIIYVYLLIKMIVII